MPFLPTEPFEIIGRFTMPASARIGDNFQCLNDNLCRLSEQGPLCIEVSEFSDGAELVNWIKNCVRYGHSAWEGFVVSAKDPQLLLDLQALQPALRTALILDSTADAARFASLPDQIQALKSDCLISSSESLAEAFKVRKAKPNLKVYVRTASSEAEAFSARKLGADGVVADDPGRIRAALAEPAPRTRETPGEPALLQEELFPAGT